jgi:hypothetical protein
MKTGEKWVVAYMANLIKFCRVFYPTCKEAYVDYFCKQGYYSAGTHSERPVIPTPLKDLLRQMPGRLCVKD